MYHNNIIEEKGKIVLEKDEIIVLLSEKNDYLEARLIQDTATFNSTRF